MRISASLFALFLMLPPAAHSQQKPLEDPPWIKEVVAERVHFSIPGMDRMKVKKDVVYKATGGVDLKADIYSSKGQKPAKGYPVVIFIHGGTLQPNLKTTIKDWGVYLSYGQLAAASGFVGVTFNTRFYDWGKIADPQSDVRDLIAYVRTNSKSLGVDPDSIALWAFSAGGVLLSEYLSNPQPYVRSMIAYYAIMDPRDVRSRIPASVADESLNSFSPVHVVRNTDKNLPPILIARAGLDKDLNSGVDAFIETALSKNLNIEILNHPNGQHAFDVLDNNERTREIIRRTLEFIKAK